MASPWAVEANKCTRKAVLSVTGCFEVQEDQAGVDDDRIVCLVLVIRSYLLENQGRTELSDCHHSFWLVRSLNTHLQEGGTVLATRRIISILFNFQDIYLKCKVLILNITRSLCSPLSTIVQVSLLCRGSEDMISPER